LAPDIECTNSLDIAAIAIGVIIAQAVVEAGFAKPGNKLASATCMLRSLRSFVIMMRACKTG
jgi:hypothetical protein